MSVHTIILTDDVPSIRTLKFSDDELPMIERQLDEIKKKIEEAKKPKYRLGDVACEAGGALYQQCDVDSEPKWSACHCGDGELWCHTTDIVGPVLFNVFDLAEQIKDGMMLVPMTRQEMERIVNSRSGIPFYKNLLDRLNAILSKDAQK